MTVAMQMLHKLILQADTVSRYFPCYKFVNIHLLKPIIKIKIHISNICFKQVMNGHTHSITKHYKI